MTRITKMYFYKIQKHFGLHKFCVCVWENDVNALQHESHLWYPWLEKKHRSSFFLDFASITCTSHDTTLGIEIRNACHFEPEKIEKMYYYKTITFWASQIMHVCV